MNDDRLSSHAVLTCLGLVPPHLVTQHAIQAWHHLMPWHNYCDIITPMTASNEAAEKAADACVKRGQEAGVEVESIVCQGIPWQEIVQKATDSGADLIIMGTHGRTGFHHVFLGRVAEKVVRLAPCPVLVTCPVAATRHP